MIENPFKTVRLEHNWTQNDCAVGAGITRQVVTLTEQGLYAVPPRSLVEVLSAGSETRRAFLRLNYPTWVSERRRLNAGYFSSVDLRGHPNSFTALMNQVAKKMQAKPGIASLSRAMVYQRSLLSEFQKFGRGRQSIFDALIECGLDPDQAVILINDKK